MFWVSSESTGWTARRTFRYGAFFGSSGAQVNLANPTPDTLGLYAATENGKMSLVIINKDPGLQQSHSISQMCRSEPTSFVISEVKPVSQSGR
jgi:hypothetical protein